MPGPFARPKSEGSTPTDNIDNVIHLLDSANSMPQSGCMYTASRTSQLPHSPAPFPAGLRACFAENAQGQEAGLAGRLRLSRANVERLTEGDYPRTNDSYDRGPRPSCFLSSEQHPIHLAFRLLDRMHRDSMPPLCRLVLIAIVAECQVDEANTILGALSLEMLSRATGLRTRVLRGAVHELIHRKWLYPIEPVDADPDVVTPFLVRLDGQPWRAGTMLNTRSETSRETRS